jgi:hypothetical protein
MIQYFQIFIRIYLFHLKIGMHKNGAWVRS